MATKLIFSSSGSLQIQTGTSAGFLMRNVTHLLFLPAEWAAQTFVSASAAADFHSQGRKFICFFKKKWHHVATIPPQSVSCNYSRWVDCIVTHALPLEFDFVHLPNIYSTPTFFLGCTSIAFLPAYVGSLVLVPKDSQIAMLCELDVFLDSLLYISSSFCPQVAMTNKYVVLSVLCLSCSNYLYTILKWWQRWEITLRTFTITLHCNFLILPTFDHNYQYLHWKIYNFVFLLGV